MNKLKQWLCRIQENMRNVFVCCNWKTVSVSLVYTCLLAGLLLRKLLAENFAGPMPSQMLSCLAYVWEPIGITNRLFSVGMTMAAIPVFCFLFLFLFSKIPESVRESTVHFGAVAVLPVIYQLLLGCFNVKNPINVSWIAFSIVLFLAVCFLHLWHGRSLTLREFVLLFESFFIPYVLFCILQLVYFCFSPENYLAYDKWENAPYISCVICTLLFAYPKNPSSGYQEKLFAVLQLLMLPLFIWILPEVYIRRGELYTLYPLQKTFWCLVFPLILLGAADIILRAYKPALMKRNLSPFPLLAILTLVHFRHFSVMGLSNFYEYGDRISAYAAIRSGSMTFFKDTTICYGIWDYLSLRLTEFFSGTLTMADTYGESVLGLLVLIFSFLVLFHLLPVWIAFLFCFFVGGWIPGLIAAVIAIWLYPAFLKRRWQWCVMWSVMASWIFFFRIPQGSMLAASFVPLFLYQLYACFMEDRKIFMRLAIFEFVWALLFFVWPFSPYFYGMLRMLYETGSINSAWAASAWVLESGDIIPLLAANAMLFFPAAAILAACVFLYSEKKEKADPAFIWGIISAAVCYAFISLSYSYSRIDDLFSRQFQTFVCLIPVILLPVSMLSAGYRQFKALLIVLVFLPLLAVPLVRKVNAPSSPSDLLGWSVSGITESAMIDGAQYDLPKAGYGYAPAGTLEELQAERELKAVLDKVLEPGETFQNLSLYGGLYFLFDRELPCRHTNYYTVTGDLTQYHILQQLWQKKVRVAVFGRDLYDSSYPMLRTHYLFRYAIANALPLRVNDHYFIMMPPAYFRKLNLPVPTVAESLKIWEDFYNRGSSIYLFNNLIYSPSVWGRNAEKLLKPFSGEEMEVDCLFDDPLSVRPDLQAPLSGEMWGLMVIDSESECWAGVSWSNEYTESYRIYFKLMPGKNIVPLDAYPSWLLAKQNQKITVFSQDHELNVKSVTFYPRYLPTEIALKTVKRD